MRRRTPEETAAYLAGYEAGRSVKRPAPQSGGKDADALLRDAERYRWLRDWLIRGGRRAEIDPHGHVRQTTPEIVDAAIDAYLGKSKP